MHQAFADTWSAIYSRLKSNPPDFDAFVREFGDAIECNPTGDLGPTAEQMHSRAAAARDDSAAGLDALKPVELKLLPLAAWKQWLRVLSLARRPRRWPSSYYRVSATILPKCNRLDPDALRYPSGVKEVRLLSIYFQLYRIEAGAWYANHRQWMATVMDKGCVAGYASW